MNALLNNGPKMFEGAIGTHGAHTLALINLSPPTRAPTAIASVMPASPSVSRATSKVEPPEEERTPSPLPSPPAAEVAVEFAEAMSPLPSSVAGVSPGARDIIDHRMSRFPILSRVLPIGNLTRASAGF